MCPLGAKAHARGQDATQREPGQIPKPQARLLAKSLAQLRQTRPQQQQQLTAEFKTLLVRTYSNALTSYKNQKVVYKAFKMAPTDTDVLVRTEVHQPGNKPVQLDYSLERLEGGWKVYDVIVAGVSLVTNYREQFSQEVRAGGIDGLIKSLQKRNAELAAGKPAAK